MNRLSRSTALKIAAILSLVLSIYGIMVAFPIVIQGAEAVNQAGDDAPPYLIMVLSFVLSIVRIVAAYGTWQNQRWGVVITLLVTALDTFAAVPGILFAPTTDLWVAATTSTILGIAIIILCLWRDSKPMQI